MTKTAPQLDAEIAEALHARKNNFRALIAKIEGAVDAHPELTRERRGGRGAEAAELSFSHGLWTARCGCRNQLAKGRSSRVDEVAGQGETPEEAVDMLVQMLPFRAERMK